MIYVYFFRSAEQNYTDHDWPPDSMKEDFGGAFRPKTDPDSYSTEGGLGAKRNPKDLSEIGGSSHDRYIQEF